MIHCLHPTTAMFPGLRYEDGVAEAIALCATRKDLDPSHLQLCPQSWGSVDEGLVRSLQERYPKTAFRLHANVRTQRGVDEVTAADDSLEAMQRLACLEQLSISFGASVYSLHAGTRQQMSLSQMLGNLRQLNERFEVAIAVEGMYPHPRHDYLLATWSDYNALLEAELPFALDLSHLNIVAYREGRRDLQMIRSLLASPHCLEVHLATNNGYADQHHPLSSDRREWWWPAFDSIHEEAVVFAEERQRVGGVRRSQGRRAGWTPRPKTL